MRAERDRRAAILNAEGIKQSAILTAEGEKQSQILRAEGSAQARILEAQGQARAIQQVFDAIHRGKPTQKLLAYQYLQVLPADRPRRLQQDVDHPERADRRPQGHRRRARAGRAAAFDDGGRRRRWVDPGPRRTPSTRPSSRTPLQALAEARDRPARPAPRPTEHAAPVIGSQHPPCAPGRREPRVAPPRGADARGRRPAGAPPARSRPQPEPAVHPGRPGAATDAGRQPAARRAAR